MKTLPPVGTNQTINNGVAVTILAHGKHNGIDVVICQVGERVGRTDNNAFDAPKPDYKGHANLAEMIKGHIDAFRDTLEYAKGKCLAKNEQDWYTHELQALLEIEAAVDAELM